MDDMLDGVVRHPAADRGPVGSSRGGRLVSGGEIGRGNLVVVYHFWNVRTRDDFAGKVPVDGLAKAQDQRVEEGGTLVGSSFSCEHFIPSPSPLLSSFFSGLTFPSSQAPYCETAKFGQWATALAAIGVRPRGLGQRPSQGTSATTC